MKTYSDTASEKDGQEFWDLYRADGRLEKVIPSRGYNIPEGFYHLTVEVIPTNMEGHVLITQRSFTKRIGPGKLEFPAGSVKSGEQPFVAARRELLEETGLRAAKLIRLGEFDQPRIHRIVYIAYIPDLCNAKITLQEEETISYTFATFNQWMNYIAQGRFDTNKLRCYTPAMLEKLEKTVGRAEEPKAQPKPKRQHKQISDDIFAPFRVMPKEEADISEEDLTLDQLLSIEEDE